VPALYRRLRQGSYDDWLDESSGYGIPLRDICDVPLEFFECVLFSALPRSSDFAGQVERLDDVLAVVQHKEHPHIATAMPDERA
jgi:hypothetical protein